MRDEQTEEELVASIEWKLEHWDVSPEERQEGEDLIRRSRQGRQHSRFVYQPTSFQMSSQPAPFRQAPPPLQAHPHRAHPHQAPSRQQRSFREHGTPPCQGPSCRQPPHQPPRPSQHGGFPPPKQGPRPPATEPPRGPSLDDGELARLIAQGKQRAANPAPPLPSPTQAASQAPLDPEKARKQAERERIAALPQEERDKLIAADRAAKAKAQKQSRIAKGLSPKAPASIPAFLTSNLARSKAAPSNSEPSTSIQAAGVADDDVAALIKAAKQREAQEALKPPPEPINEELAALIAKGKERKAQEELEKKDAERKAKKAEKEAKRVEREAKVKGKKTVKVVDEEAEAEQEDLLQAMRRAAVTRFMKKGELGSQSKKAPTENTPETARGSQSQHQPWLNLNVQGDKPESEPTPPSIKSRPQPPNRPQPRRQQPTVESDVEEGNMSLEQADALHQTRIAELQRSRAEADAAPDPEMERIREEESGAAKVTARLKTPPPPSSS